MKKVPKDKNKPSVRIATKFLAAFIIIITLSIFGFAYQCLQISGDILYRQTEKYINDMMLQTNQNIEIRLKEFTELVFSIQSDETVQSYLSAEKRSAPSYSLYLARREMINSIYRQIIFNNKIASVYIVSDAGNITCINKTLEDYSLPESTKEICYAALGGPVWLNSDPKLGYLNVSAQINSLITQRPLGYLVLNIHENCVSSIFSYMDFYEKGEVMLINSDFRIVSHPDQSKLNMTAPEEFGGLFQQKHSSGFFSDIYMGKECYIAYRQTGETGWYLLSILPTDVYKKNISVLKNAILILAGGIALLAFLTSILATTFITRPIRRLTSAMRRFGEGDFTVYCEVDTRDEIGTLSENFNNMVHNINVLVDQVYHETLYKQQAELKSLRMQINPHFLYNTLETINWIGRINGVTEVGLIAKALGDLMRTMTKGDDFITIKEELQNVNDYLYIQQFRYSDKLKTIIQVPEILSDFYIPKLVLQPLLENSIVHGIENKVGPGHIWITGSLDVNNIITLQVRDDGIGIEQERIKQIFDPLSEMVSSTGIGIRNVDKRLKLYYGESFGVDIESVVGSFTTVTVRFPGQLNPPILHTKTDSSPYNLLGLKLSD